MPNSDDRRTEGAKTTKYRVQVRKPIEFLKAVLPVFVGDARLSLEGDLSVFDENPPSGTTREETQILRRNTSAPKQDFAVITLDSRTLPHLLALLPRLDIRSRILNIQIEQGGALRFRAYDQIHPERVWVEETFGESLLQVLVARGVIKAYQVMSDAV
jgi:hypothetical protein